jgi:hypothetical protein
MTMMNTSQLSSDIRILYIPSYYETHFDLALDRFIPHDKYTDYHVHTIESSFISVDLNHLLIMCRIIINEERIQMLVTDSHIGQLIVSKLAHEYPRIHCSTRSFLSIYRCIHRSLMMKLFDVGQCLPTLMLETRGSLETHLASLSLLLDNEHTDVYVKSVYGFDQQLSSFRLSDCSQSRETIHRYIELYREQHRTSLQSFLRIYMPIEQYSTFIESNYLVQPFYDLLTYPHWRLIIANACIYDREILMWPLVDGYSGW